jgi:hypothetical protein
MGGVRNMAVRSITMSAFNASLSKYLMCVWATEKNKMVQFEAMWQKVMRALEMEMGV